MAGKIALNLGGGAARGFAHIGALRALTENDIRVKRLERTPDNTLTESEKRDGWQLLFDGRTHAGWMNSDTTAPRTPVQDGLLNPHRAGHSLEVEGADLAHRVLGRPRELFAQQEALGQGSGQPFDARGQVHRSADAGKVQARGAADVAVGDLTQVQRHAHRERWLAALAAVAVERRERRERFANGGQRKQLCGHCRECRHGV